MEILRPDALKIASYPGFGSDVTMPHQQAPTWMVMQSGKPKIDPMEINDLLYANVGVDDVPLTLANGFEVSRIAVGSLFSYHCERWRR